MTEITEKLSNNGLFIVGHARSGTSILQTALDLCPDIFLLNEANLHCHHYKENFVVWYRGMHANLGNPLSKLNSCPIPDDVAGDGFDVVLTARRTHKYVGDKLAFRNRALNGTYDAPLCYEFFAKYFWGSHFVCITRNPRDVLGSNKRLFSVDDLTGYAFSYLETLQLCMNIATTFDKAFMFFHEDIGKPHFDLLGQSLGCDLSQSHLVYSKPAQDAGRYTGVENDLDPAVMEKLEYFYNAARKLFFSARMRTITQPTHLLNKEITEALLTLRPAAGVKAQRKVI